MRYGESETPLGLTVQLCGEEKNVEMHHVRHIREREVEGFTQIMQQMNRKQIPVCRECHTKIHAGRYDGFPVRGGVLFEKPPNKGPFCQKGAREEKARAGEAAWGGPPQGAPPRPYVE
jgi:rubrerythrin